MSADSGQPDANPPHQDAASPHQEATSAHQDAASAHQDATAGSEPGPRRESRLFRRRIFPRRPRLRRAILGALAVFVALVVVFCAVSARLFIWPATGMPARVDAIVVLGGPQAQQRLALGLRLGEEGKARYVLVSEGVTDPVPGLCQPHATFTVICWNPVPGTTQGEAEFIGQITRRRGWNSVVLVTTPDQAWRAQLRVSRCYPGQVYSMTTPLPLNQWPYQLAYQWGSAFRAEVLQRGC